MVARPIAELYRGGHAAHHDVVRRSPSVIAAHSLPRDLFDELIDAREFDSRRKRRSPDRTALEAYCDATSGHLMRLAARILGAGDTLTRWRVKRASPMRSQACAARCRSRGAPASDAARRSPHRVGCCRSRTSLPGTARATPASAARRHGAQRARGHLAGIPEDCVARERPSCASACGAGAALSARAHAAGVRSVPRHSRRRAAHRRQLAMLGAMMRRRI